METLERVNYSDLTNDLTEVTEVNCCMTLTLPIHLLQAVVSYVIVSRYSSCRLHGVHTHMHRRSLGVMPVGIFIDSGKAFDKLGVKL